LRSIDRSRLKTQLLAEQQRFSDTHPQSRALAERAAHTLLGGVPMHWMHRMPGVFPIFVREGSGAHFTDVDGHRYIDFCLGDTGAMMGHANPVAVRAVERQMQHGSTFMLPIEDAIWVGQELAHRFRLPFWQFALSATDANRFSIRLARHITGRPKILVFNWCYHGTVDETFITLDDGLPRLRPGNIGAPVDPNLTTRVVEWNDIDALEQALLHGDVACVIAEPVMTNIGIIHPLPGYHDALRDLTRRAGSLLIMDETHTICAGPGGCTLAYSLDPDIVTLGKPIGGGIPAAAYGCSAEVAERINRVTPRQQADTGGIGGTLAGNALSVVAMRATLEFVLTEAAFRTTIPLAERWAAGVASVIYALALPWHVSQLGCRAEYWYRQEPLRNGGEAAAAYDVELDQYLHLAALNRGILMTPFHNMALIAPDTTTADIDQHTAAFRQAVSALLG
jgi:glutamate-1-semialdehyde 2,1-aminomutase